MMETGLYVSSAGSNISVNTLVSAESFEQTKHLHIYGKKKACSGSQCTITPDLLGANPTETHIWITHSTLRTHSTHSTCAHGQVCSLLVRVDSLRAERSAEVHIPWQQGPLLGPEQDQ